VTASRKPAAADERPPGERLLSAAEHLFGERSYRRTSVAGICARAGIATGSFYAHYRSKADIFTAVIRQINADLRSAMAAALKQADGNQRARGVPSPCPGAGGRPAGCPPARHWH